MVEGYLDELRVARRLAVNTLDSYSRDLEALQRFATARGVGVDRLSRDELEGFVRELMEGGLSPRSVARHVACVRGFYRFLVRDGQIRRNPADDLHAPRAWPALPKFLSRDEVDLLIEQPDVSTSIGLRTGRSSSCSTRRV